MVFESVVVDILNRYLKPYVKKLDTSQLKVGVWKGEQAALTEVFLMHARSSRSLKGVIVSHCENIVVILFLNRFH